MTPSLYCLREPQEVKKGWDDFCMYHPAWPEFESRNEGKPISDYYEQHQG